MDPLAAGGHLTLATVFLLRGQTKEGLASARRAVEIDASDEGTQVSVALAELQSGAILSGLTRLQRLVRVDPSPMVPTLGLLGSLNYRTGRVDAAVGLWERARAASAESIPARLELAVHYETAGRHDRAAVLVEEIRRINPDYTVSDSDFFARNLLPDDPTPYFEALRAAGLPDEPTSIPPTSPTAPASARVGPESHP